jgi:hypothetical protein
MFFFLIRLHFAELNIAHRRKLLNYDLMTCAKIFLFLAASANSQGKIFALALNLKI